MTRSRAEGTLAAALAALLLFGKGVVHAEPGSAPHGSIVGTVTTEATRQPVPAVAVIVEGPSLVADSDSAGRFSFPQVPAGTYQVLFTKDGYAAVYKSEVVITANRQTQLQVMLQELPRLRDEVEVTASAFAKPRDAATSAFQMGSEEVRRAPGALGDVNRLIQTMPGAAARDDQRNDIVARGGSPAENLTLVDHVEVPNLNHFAAQGTSGGPISMLNTELIQEASFLAGGFPARFGNRLSSVLEISLREGSRQRFEADVEAGFSGAGLMLEGPLSSRGSWLVSARRSFLDLVSKDFGVSAVPVYSNYQAKAVYDLDPRNRLTFVGLGGRDEIHFDADPADESEPSLLDFDNRGWRTVNGLVWQKLLGTRGVGVLALSHAFSDYRLEVHDRQLDGALVVRDDSSAQESTLRYDLSLDVPRLGNVRAGVSAKRLTGSFDIAQPLGLSNPYSLDPTRVDAVAIDQSLSANEEGLYLQVSRAVGPVDVTAGARYDHFGASATSTLGPRGGLTYHLGPRLELSASYGQYSQMPALISLVADPVNRRLPPIRADHYVVGFTFRPTSAVKLTVEAFDKRYSHYPVSVEHPTVSLASSGSQFNVTGTLFPLVSRGTGRARGIELYLQQKLTGRLYGQLSYAYSRTEHRALDGVLRPGGFDLPHVFSAFGGVRMRSNLEISSKFTFTSGRPETPYLLAASQAQNRPILDVSRVNAVRSLAYHRLDLRVDRRFGFGWGNLIAFLEAQNVYDRKNVQLTAWNFKTRAPERVRQISRLLLGGFDFQF